jgi:hypothetical protein
MRVWRARHHRRIREKTAKRAPREAATALLAHMMMTPTKFGGKRISIGTSVASIDARASETGF